MRQRLWSLAIAGLGLGGLAVVGGTTTGGDLGPLAAGYGFLLVLAALYLVAALAIRERVWRRLRHPTASLPGSVPDRLAGRRVF